ncbi:MAG: heme ABC exporter ATP-binding protein CcmA [Bauldia sp.]
MTRLIAQGLAADRGGRSIFVDLSLEVGPGELLAVVGPNGAGKSTLLRVLAGLLRPAAGSVALAPGDDRPVSASVAYLGHLDALKGAETVAENLRFWRRLAETPGRPVEEALAAVRLEHLDDTPAAYLSAGQRRRVAIARLLVDRRPVWLLDEPANALDAGSERSLAAILADHLASGGVIVAASHTPLPVAPTATLTVGGRP